MVLEQKAWVLKCVCTVVELSTIPRSHLLIRLKYLVTPTQSRITELSNKVSTVKKQLKREVFEVNYYICVQKYEMMNLSV